MDQSKIAGIGNIYASESLWRAKIDPRRRANSLSAEEAAAVHEGIVGVLADAISQLGTTLGNGISDYRRSAEAGGSFQNHLAVYGRENEPCERCATPVLRILQGGRSTYLCPSCQKTETYRVRRTTDGVERDNPRASSIERASLVRCGRKAGSPVPAAWPSDCIPPRGWEKTGHSLRK